MRNLRKFNESKNIDEIFNIEFIESCFIEFIDDDSYERENISGEIYITIKVDDKKLPNFMTPTIDSLIQANIWIGELYASVKNSLDKVKTEYDEIYTNVYFEDRTEHVDDSSFIHIHIRPNTDSGYERY